MWSQLLYLSLNGAESKSQQQLIVWALPETADGQHIKSKEGHRSLTTQFYCLHLFTRSTHFSRIFMFVQLVAAAGTLRKLSRVARDINISHYLILSSTTSRSSHNGLTCFLGCTSHSVPWITPFVIIFMSPVMCRGSVAGAALRCDCTGIRCALWHGERRC